MKVQSKRNMLKELDIIFCQSIDKIYSIGRSYESDINLPDLSISRDHAIIKCF